MKQFTYVIQDPLGIHARVAGALVKEVKTYQSEITLSTGEKTVNLSHLIALMTMAIKQNETVVISLTGENEEEECCSLQQFFAENL